MGTENVMRMGSWNGYRKWKGYRKLEWVKDVRKISGCGKGYRILEWALNMKVGMRFVSGYRKLEWVQENGIGREKCYGTENGIDTGSWNTYRKWNQ